MEASPYTRKAWYHETDQMGIIHHANYIRWFEEARVDFLEKLGYGYNRAMESGIDFALLGLSCEYKSMVRFGDTVRIFCQVASMGNARMSVRYRVEDAATGELRATGETQHCFFSAKLQRPVSLKKTVPELYALLAAQYGGKADAGS